MGTVANVMPCPCCDRGGFDYEPCPSRVDLDKFQVEVNRLREELQDANHWRDRLANKVIEVEAERDRARGRVTALLAGPLQHCACVFPRGGGDPEAECTVHAEVRSVLGAVVHEADIMLAGGELAIQHAEQCSECGCGGAGPLRDALHKARGLAALPRVSEEKP